DGRIVAVDPRSSVRKRFVGGSGEDRPRGTGARGPDAGGAPASQAPPEAQASPAAQAAPETQAPPPPPEPPTPPEPRTPRLVGGPGAVVLPGLINAHHHGNGITSFARGVQDDNLEPWLPALGAAPAVDPYLDTLWAAMDTLEAGY